MANPDGTYDSPDPGRIETNGLTATGVETPWPPPALLERATSATRDAFLALSESLGRPRAGDDEVKAADFEAQTLEPGAPLPPTEMIVGAGLGLTGDDDDIAGAPGSPCVELYTAEPMSVHEAAGRALTLGVDATVLEHEECHVRTLTTGPIDLLAHRFSLRPAAGGVSIGHHATTAGTLGALARGRTPPRDARLLVLSNNHVLALNNEAQGGDELLQPGAYDGGTSPTDVIGYLERFVKIDFTGPNRVDCATGWVDEPDVRRDLVHVRSGRLKYFQHSALPRTAVPGMLVGKTGRTTQLTAGTVRAVGVTIRVNMGQGRVATFVDQISVTGTHGAFSAGGDSGSLIWTWDEQRDPVGLLFAGGGGTTFANRIDHVLAALDVELL